MLPSVVVMQIDYTRMRGAARRLSAQREAVLDELPLHRADTGETSAETAQGLARVSGACRELAGQLARISAGVVDTCDDFWATDELLVSPDFRCLVPDLADVPPPAGR